MEEVGVPLKTKDGAWRFYIVGDAASSEIHLQVLIGDLRFYIQ